MDNNQEQAFRRAMILIERKARSRFVRPNMRLVKDFAGNEDDTLKSRKDDYIEKAANLVVNAALVEIEERNRVADA